MHEIYFGKQRFLGRPDRTLFHPSSGTLFLSDLHLGKGHLFRCEGIPIPKELEAQDLNRLILALQATKAKSFWVLGDLFHHPGSITSKLMSKWHHAFEKIDVQRSVILGNHDRSAQQFASNLGFSIQPEPSLWYGIELAHHPDRSGELPRIAGHVHPQVEFRNATDHLVCPCFAIPNERCLLLPAFTEFSGGPRFSAKTAQLFPIIDKDVLDSRQMTIK